VAWLMSAGADFSTVLNFQQSDLFVKAEDFLGRRSDSRSQITAKTRTADGLASS
jgi:hypothetical protein